MSHRLQRRHFVGLADAVSKMKLGKEARIEVIKCLNAYLCSTNSSFDGHRFEKYINTQIANTMRDNYQINNLKKSTTWDM